MLRKLFKWFAYSQSPRATFAVLHPIETAQWIKLPWDLRYAYAPRITALITALLIAPLAFRLGKRAAEGSLFDPSRHPDRLAQEEARS